MSLSCIAFHLETDFTLSVANLDALLQQHALQPCGAMDLSRQGFINVDADEPFAIEVERNVFLRHATESRLLPASVIKEHVEAECRQWTQQKGFPPGRKVKRDLKEKVLAALIPQAFTRRSSHLVWIDRDAHRVVVMAGSTDKAEGAVSALREVIGSLEVTPLPPPEQMVLRRWLKTGVADAPFTLGDGCMLAHASEGSSIRCTHFPISDERIATLVDEGYEIRSIDVLLPSGTSLKLSDKNLIKGIRLSTTTDEAPEADAAAQFRADLLLQASNLREAFDGVGGMGDPLAKAA